jgi:hypothetical protein
MNARFHVSADPATGLVTIRLGGFFTDANVVELREHCRREYARLGDRLGRHVTVVDIADVDIQSREGLSRFGDLLAEPGLHGRRLAFVVPKSLARSQARRLATYRNAAFFDDIDAAHGWLLDPDSSRAA